MFDIWPMILVDMRTSNNLKVIRNSCNLKNCKFLIMSWLPTIKPVWIDRSCNPRGYFFDIKNVCPQCQKVVEERDILLLQDDREGCVYCCQDYNCCEQCGYWVSEDIKDCQQSKHQVCQQCFIDCPECQKESHKTFFKRNKIRGFVALGMIKSQLL
jgi:hypothetical protein